MSTGDIIGQDITAAEPIIAGFVSTFNPAIGGGVALALKLLAAAEPAVYNAIAAAIQRTELTPDQISARDAAIVRLQNPGSYFADPSPPTPVAAPPAEPPPASPS